MYYTKYKKEGTTLKKIQIKTILLVGISTLLFSGCSTSPKLSYESSLNIISGEINPKSKIPKCTKGYQDTWISRSEYTSLEVVEGLLVSHSEGTGIKQEVCKTKSGNIRFHIRKAKILETVLVKEKL